MLPGSQTKWLFLLLVVSLCFNAGVGATFGYRSLSETVEEPVATETTPERKRLDRCERLHDALGLSPEQRETFSAAKQELFDRMHEKRKELKAASAELAELICLESPDQEEIAIRIAEVESMRTQMRLEMVKHFLALKSELRPDQHDAMDDLIRRVFSRGGPGFGGGPKGPRGRGLDKEERRARILRRHPEADLDGDGTLSEEEAKTFKSNRPGRKRGPGRRPAPADQPN